MSRSDIPIIHTISALDSLVERGITLDNGLLELVDNAVDWGANLIHIHIWRWPDGSISLSVADNGAGIADSVLLNSAGEGEPCIAGQEGSIDGILQALRVGGRIRRPNRHPIGRFGFGLPQTGIALSERTTVYSRTRDGVWRKSSLSLKELKSRENWNEEGRPMLPAVEMEDPPRHVLPEGWECGPSGTVVHMDSIPKEKHRIARFGSLVARMEEEIGRRYRYPIQGGLTILFSVAGVSDDPQPIAPRDPLCLMPTSPDHRWGDTRRVDLPVDVQHDSVFLDGTGKKPLIIDEVTGEPAEIKITMARIEPRSVRQILGIPLSRAPGRKEMEKAGFSLSKQGFSLVRGTREIEGSSDLGLYVKTTNLNYFRGEIRFPPIRDVDRIFGIEPDKSKFRIDARLSQWLGIGSAIGSIERKTRQATKSLSQAPPSEHARRGRTTKKPLPNASLEASSTTLSEIAPPNDAVDKRKAAESRERLIKEEYDRVEDYFSDRIRSELLAERVAKDAEDWVAADAARKEITRLEGEMTDLKEQVGIRFETPARFRRLSRSWASQDLYRTEATGPEELSVILNENTPVYRHLIEPSESSHELKTMVTLMIWAIAYSDDDRRHPPEKRAFWDRARALIGRYSALMLGALEDQHEEDEKVPRRKKSEVIRSISEMLGIEKPPDMKGSTVPGEWLDEVHFTLKGEKSVEMSKPDTYISIMELLAPLEDSDQFLSTGSTITLNGYLAMETALGEMQEGL